MSIGKNKKQATLWQKRYIKSLILEKIDEFWTGPQLRKYLLKFPLYESREQRNAIGELSGKKRTEALAKLPAIDYCAKWCKKLDADVRDEFKDVAMVNREAIRGQIVQRTMQLYRRCLDEGDLSTARQTLKDMREIFGLDSATKFEVKSTGEVKFSMANLHRSKNGEFDDRKEEKELS